MSRRRPFLRVLAAPPTFVTVLLVALLGAVMQPVDAQDSLRLRGVVRDGATAEPLELVSVLLSGDSLNGGSPLGTTTDAAGRYALALPAAVGGDAEVTFRYVGYARQLRTVDALLRDGGDVALAPDGVVLETVTVRDRSRGTLAQATLRDVDGTAIYAGRKNELILPENLAANLATNNAREVYKGVAGLTVWESDAGGLQLSIGARGLDPNRSSNFNVRQNGFDISADALGYPESYYTPPAQALARIELVRGAAGLQYGTQFGGLLNFKLKEGDPDRRFSGSSEQTVGSYGLFNSFNEVGGTVGKASYYAFGQYKRGDAWRDNAGFAQGTGYLDVHYDVTPRLRIGVELTRMHYLAQQAGGLLDFEFAVDPRASKRARNYFRVNWGLAALHVDYEIGARTKLNVRTFALDARREALGELGPINRPDPGRERDLVDGAYRNFGQEARLLHRYTLGGRPATLVVGTRLYSGLTRNRQGLASAGADADFRFLNPDSLERSDYRFPSRNYAAFAEHLIGLGGGWSVTPGLRAEYIRTASEGYYRRTVRAGNTVLLDERVPDAQRNARSLVIAGLGMSYRPGERLEAYANGSQNYRAINFSDLVVVNPNLLIDSTLTDERGYNLELGLRGTGPEGAWRFDASAFYLRYANRIGLREVLVPDAVTVERAVSLRTNVGAADLVGLEFFGEVDVARLAAKPRAGDWSVRPFVNLSLIRGRYTSGGPAVEGRAVELVPPVSGKVGVDAAYRRWRAQWLTTYVRAHFSDATNAVRVADATRGTIPSYTVSDVTVSYRWGRWRVQAGVNNVLDARYFTRRASGYPGPGIIPAEARAGYVGVRVSW